MAGTIDLKVDSECHYNGKTCDNGKWTGTDIPCACLWAEKDLTPQDVFFNFSDVKPGDKGEDTVSLRVQTTHGPA